MDAENAPHVAAVATGLLAEVGGVTGVPREERVRLTVAALEQDEGAYILGSWSPEIHSFMWKAEMGCSEVAMRYFSSPSPPETL